MTEAQPTIAHGLQEESTKWPETFEESVDFLKNHVLKTHEKLRSTMSQLKLAYQDSLGSHLHYFNEDYFMTAMLKAIGPLTIYTYYGNRLQLVSTDSGEDALAVNSILGESQKPDFTTNKPAYYVGTNAESFHIHVSFAGTTAIVVAQDNKGKVQWLRSYAQREYTNAQPFEQVDSTVFILVAFVMDIYSYMKPV